MDLELKIDNLLKDNSKIFRTLTRTLPCLLNSKNYVIPKNGAELKEILNKRRMPETDNIYFTDKAEDALDCFVQELLKISEIDKNNSWLNIFRIIKNCVKNQIKKETDYNHEQFLRNLITILLQEQKEYLFIEAIYGIKLEDVNLIDLGVCRTFRP